MSLVTVLGFQNCSPDQFYKDNQVPSGPRIVSTEISQLMYQPGSGLPVKLEAGQSSKGSIIVDLETGIVIFNYRIGTETVEKNRAKEVKLDGKDLEKIRTQFDSIKIRNCTEDEVQFSVCGSYDKLVLKSIYQTDPDKKLYFGEHCESANDLIADSGQKELHELLLKYEPIEYALFQ
jgi:hypothetical protein